MAVCGGRRGRRTLMQHSMPTHVHAVKHSLYIKTPCTHTRHTHTCTCACARARTCCVHAHVLVEALKVLRVELVIDARHIGRGRRVQAGPVHALEKGVRLDLLRARVACVCRHEHAAALLGKARQAAHHPRRTHTTTRAGIITTSQHADTPTRTCTPFVPSRSSTSHMRRRMRSCAAGLILISSGNCV